MFGTIVRASEEKGNVNLADIDFILWSATATRLSLLNLNIEVVKDKMIERERFNKLQQYEAYKQYLRSLNLTSAEYEKRIREWCKKMRY